MIDTSVYSRLKKLFSTGTIIRSVGGKKLRVVDADQIQSFVNRRAIDRYHRFYSNQTGGYGSTQGRYETAAAYHGARLQLFRDYDMMDADPIIASVLDVYADESTMKDEFGQILGIKTTDQKIQDVLHNLFYDVLNVEFNLWPWMRNMCKYGDFFLHLNIHPEYGIVNVLPFSVYETMRIEGEDPKKPFEVKFRIDNDFLNIGKKEFDNYEIAHFRLLADTNFLPYGKATLENGRRVWKQLQLMEDAMLIHRIMRAPDKRKISIDVGNIPTSEVDGFMAKIIAKTKKAPLIDQKTGDYNLRYNMMNITEDFYIPRRGKDDGTNIENLQGLTFNAIEDIEYLRRKLIAAFKVPKAFIGYDEDVAGKAILAAQDVRFARTIERLQRILLSELTKIAMIHLYTQGYTDEDMVNFQLTMASPSTVYEHEKIAIWQEKIQLAQTITESKLLSRAWTYTNILELSEDQAKEEKKLVAAEVKEQAELEKLQQEIMQPPQPPVQGAPSEEQSSETPAQDGEEQQEEPSADETPDDGEPNDESEVNQEEVDELLDSLKNMEDEESMEEGKRRSLYSKKVGRPAKGYRMNHDGHVLGRDPLGSKENRNPLRESPGGQYFLESLKKLDSIIIKKDAFKQIITEDIVDKQTD